MTREIPFLDTEELRRSSSEPRRPNPFLHQDGERIYNPLTDRALAPGDPRHATVARLLAGELAPEALELAELEALEADGWLAADPRIESERFLLKYVSLEAHTVCNQACYFCPVSVDPREAYFMPTEQYEDIVRQLTAYRDTIEAVFMINYNEPTADKRFVEQVRTLRQAGLPPATLTNGTGLTPERIDALVEMGGLRFLSINISTLDRQRYREDRGADHVDLVLRNLDHAKDRAVAEEMDIVVLGTGNESHRSDYEAILRHFEGSRFRVKYFEVMDRAGYLQIGLAATHGKLCGCENVGSRPLQHLHVTPRGQCLLCCEDYDERYVVGDLNQETVEEVLTGPTLSLLRRWVYGVEEAPADFICRRCVFARTRS